MFISNLDYQLIEKMATKIYDESNSEIITEEDIQQALENLNQNLDTSKFEFCSSIETVYYTYSVILSEVRQKKREITSALFEQNPKLAQEKSVLIEKLDADPEYATIHKVEELLFNFIEHLKSIKNNVVYVLIKEDELVEN